MEENYNKEVNRTFVRVFINLDWSKKVGTNYAEFLEGFNDNLHDREEILKIRKEEAENRA